MRVILEIKGDSTDLISTNMERVLALLPSLIEVVKDVNRDNDEMRRLFDLYWQRKEDGMITTRETELEFAYDEDAIQCTIKRKYLTAWHIVIESKHSHVWQACRLLRIIDNNVMVIDEE